MLSTVNNTMVPPLQEENYGGRLGKSAPRAGLTLGFRANSNGAAGSNARHSPLSPKQHQLSPKTPASATYQLFQPQPYSSTQTLSAAISPTATQPNADLADTEIPADPVGEASSQLSQMALSPPGRSSQLYLRRSKSTTPQNGDTSPLTSPKTGPNSKASTNLSHIPCKFFKAGACTAGKNCVFSHNKDPGADSYVCKYYLKGNCKFGNKCALSHALPNDRKGMNGRPMIGRLTASQSSGTRSVSNGQLDMRSPTTRGLSAGVDFSQNPVSPGRGSFGGDNGSPFTRIPIPINAKSPTADHSPGRPFSHLTASIKQPQEYYGTSPSSFYDDPRRPKLIPVAPSSSSHLSPLPIRQKSVPDMYKASPTGSDLSSSPFHNPSQPKTLFLPPMSYGSDNGGVLSPSHLQTLRSIPEGGDYFGDVEDYEGEEEGLDLGQEQSFLPSSLNELLTPTELEMRRLREERASFRDSRRNYSDFERDDQYLSVYSSSADPQNGPILIGRSLPVGVGVGIGFSRSYGSQRNGDLGGDDLGLSLFRNSPRQGTFDYPDDPPNTSAVPATAPSASDAFASHHHHGTTAINIPGGSHGFSHGVSHSVPTGHSAMAFAAPKRFNAPDPFSPFAADDEVQFFMEEENLEQLSPQLHKQGGFGAPSAQQQQAQGGGGKAPMSYSAIAKSGLKDTGVTGGVSVDTGRRNEPVRGP